METKINIAEILKDKPQGTKLWTDMFGSVTLYVVTDVCDAFQVKHHNKKPWFDKEGKLYKEGVLCIYPSKSMRDWEKFAWKKGDVLVHKDGTVHIIFEGFEDDTYRTFKGKYYLWEDNGHIEQFDDRQHCMETSVFIKANDDAKTYINTIEERLGGKLNRETLEIEPSQPEFKDGEILFVQYLDMTYIIIYSQHSPNSKSDKEYAAYVSLDNDLRKINYDNIHNVICKKDVWEIRLATDEEKKQLFDAFAKEGKAWDAEKKQIVDLKPKWTPKPFDRVITRNDADDVWTANIFSHMDSYGEYVTIACVGGYTYCLPYNEKTAKLIGTTNNVEG